MRKKIIGKDIYLDDLNNPNVKEFLSIIQDILDNDDIKRLDYIYQHMGTSRLDHSTNVAFYCYLYAKKHPSINMVDVTRAGLLHDFFLYDWRTTTLGYHPSEHPRQALINAKKNFYVSDIMEDAIISHMWPISRYMPHHREGWIVTFSDKYCATLEIFQTLGKLITRKKTNVEF